jgi:hypothetical protein
MPRPSRPPGAAGRIIDAHTHVGISATNYLATAYPYAMSIEDLVVRMDLLGIAKAVVMPFDSSYYLARRGRAKRNGMRGLVSSFPCSGSLRMWPGSRRADASGPCMELHGYETDRILAR